VTLSQTRKVHVVIDPLLSVVAFGIGIVVGLTGMGGGALMTPVMVFFFGITPLAAVSSDLVAAAVMKPVGSFVHLRRGTVDLRLVRWLALGSVPAAFSGVLLMRALGDGEAVEDAVQTALGIALLLAATGLAAKAYLRLLERARRRGPNPADRRTPRGPNGLPRVAVKPLPTVLIGVVGGLVVGMTSVGSGSLMIVALLVLYPRLTASQLVGTDLLQAVPLVFAAAFGHLLFGDFKLDVTTSLLLGSVPGVWLGAQLSSRAPGGLIRRALAFVLLASGLKLLDVSNTITVAILGVTLVAGPVLWMLARRRLGLPALAGRDLRRVRAARAERTGRSAERVGSDR
jgi:uncharacterized membrane protein YfcA